VSAPTIRPAAVIFDMDGLMLDTEPLAARAWSEAALSLDLSFDVSIAPRLVGRTFSDCRLIIAEHHGPGYPIDVLMSGWHATYDAIVDREGLVIKPGLLELLAWIEEAGLPRAVATSTRRERACAKLTRTGLLPRFHSLVGGDEVPRGKPAPDIFVEAAARLDLPPADCLVLEDSLPGYLGARAAGMAAIVVPDGEGLALAEAPLPPTTMPSLHEVRAFLAALPVRRIAHERVG
jgi:HAD superfamily hydrolase (TIGR01509 family)